MHSLSLSPIRGLFFLVSNLNNLYTCICMYIHIQCTYVYMCLFISTALMYISVYCVHMYVCLYMYIILT